MLQAMYLSQKSLLADIVIADCHQNLLQILLHLKFAHFFSKSEFLFELISVIYQRMSMTSAENSNYIWPFV